MKETTNTERVRSVWDKYRYVALVMIVGVGLMIWPTGRNAARSEKTVATQQRDIQREMEAILEKIAGVGQVQVMLTEENDGERELAQDTELSCRGGLSAPEEYSRRSETVLTDVGSGDEAIVTQTRYPTYRGALIVCQGGDQAAIRLAVTQAVSALTGLPADRIAVEKWQ